MDSKFDLSDEELRQAGEEAAADMAVIVSESGLTPKGFFARLGRKLEAMRLAREANIGVADPT